MGATARSAAAPLARVWFRRGAVDEDAAPPAVAVSTALAESWEWRALFDAGADVVSCPGALADVAADLARHLPGLAAAPGFRCASLARVVH